MNTKTLALACLCLVLGLWIGRATRPATPAKAGLSPAAAAYSKRCMVWSAQRAVWDGKLLPEAERQGLNTIQYGLARELFSKDDAALDGFLDALGKASEKDVNWLWHIGSGYFGPRPCLLRFSCCLAATPLLPSALAHPTLRWMSYSSA